MQMMGHKNLRMTLRYLEITQPDLQREFHVARHNGANPHLVPKLPLPATLSTATPDLPGIRLALAAARRLLEMYRRQLGDEKARLKLQRLDKRLLAVAVELDHLTPPEK